MAVLWTAIGVTFALLAVLPIVGYSQPWSSRERHPGDGIVGALIGLFTAALVGLVGVSVAYSYSYAHYDERVVECTVTGLETRGLGTPLIATRQCGGTGRFRLQSDLAPVGQRRRSCADPTRTDLPVPSGRLAVVVGWRRTARTADRSLFLTAALASLLDIKQG